MAMPGLKAIDVTLELVYDAIKHISTPTIKWEDAEVANHNPWYRQRCTLEVWHIQSEKDRMKKDDGPA